MIFATVATLLALFLCIYYTVSKRKSKVPPGLKEIPYIKGLPIIGVLHKMKPTLPHYLQELANVHGPMYKIPFGMREIIVLNDFDSIKKAFKDNAENFSGRLLIDGISYMTLYSGFAFRDGEKCAKQRSFFIKVLRDFGLGKSKSAEIVENERLYLLNELKENEGKCVDFERLIPIYTANIISKFIMSKRFSRDDPKFHLLEKLGFETGKKIELVERIHLVFPMLDRFEFLMRVFGLKLYEQVYDMFRHEIKEHTEALDFDSEGEDLIDRFLIEQQHMKESTGSVDSFTDSTLVRSLYEVFVAGYDTTSTTLGWAMFLMAKFPFIQNKVYQEIKDNIGEERLPTMNDKKYLNYTQAVMDEVFRFANPAPLGLMHRTFNDCNINGFFIPGNTAIISNLFACHLDPKIWKNPNQFYPEHFLSDVDDNDLKYLPRDELIPFSMGKRQCLGESLGRMEYFLFFTGILQRFKVKFTEELTEKQYEEVLIGNDGILRCPTRNNYFFEKR